MTFIIKKLNIWYNFNVIVCLETSFKEERREAQTIICNVFTVIVGNQLSPLKTHRKDNGTWELGWVVAGHFQTRVHFSNP